MQDYKYYNEVNKETRQEREWVNHEKNRIMRMSNRVRKQKAWSKLFTPMSTPDDSYLLKGVIY